MSLKVMAEFILHKDEYEVKYALDNKIITDVNIDEYRNVINTEQAMQLIEVGHFEAAATLLDYSINPNDITDYKHRVFMCAMHWFNGDREHAQLPIEEQIALYYKLKKERPDAFNFDDETELTMYGYAFLWEDKVLEAIEVFKLIVAEFPNSSNAYDSLGEAYLKNGNKELSLYNYEKSLALNPENFNAEDQIERIKFPNKIRLKPTEKFVKIFSAKEYRADLDQLGNTLLKVHPNALKFLSKEDFWRAVEAKKALMTESTTYGTFAWHCSEIIAKVNCSHTNMGSFNYEAALLPAAARFPVQTLWVNNQFFVVDPLNNGENVKIKDEIVRINGVDVAKMIIDI